MQTPPRQRQVGEQPSADSVQIDAIDQLIAENGVFAFDAAQVEDLRLGLIRDAVGWHLRAGSPYAAYAARQGFDPAELRAAAGLNRVPLLPSMLFKREAVTVAHPESDGILWTTSSGTKGSISRIPRDDITLRRFFASIGNLSNEMLAIENSDISVFNLGPDADEARNLWISYVMAGMAVMLPRSSYYIRAETFRVEELISDLHAATGERIAVIGPPPLLLDLAETLLARRITLNLRADSVLVAIGGWKRRSGEWVPRSLFDERLSAAIRLPAMQVRDTFNMVELNTVLIECSHKRLHIPPWLYVRARDTATLGVLPGGASGVLSYLDPTARSYPSFFLSDDLGIVEENVVCACGRWGDIMRIERRLNTMESRGCALKMELFNKG